MPALTRENDVFFIPGMRLIAVRAIELLVFHLRVRPQLFLNCLAGRGEFGSGRTSHQQALDDRSVCFSGSCDHKDLTEAVNNASFIDVIRGHLHLHAIANGQPDKAFPHFTGDMGEDLMLV